MYSDPQMQGSRKVSGTLMCRGRRNVAFPSALYYTIVENRPETGGLSLKMKNKELHSWTNLKR